MIEMLFRRGAPMAIDLVATDPGALTLAELEVEMRLKKATASRQAPPPTVASVANFTVSYTPAAGADPAFWRGTIGFATTGDLSPGLYIADAEISLDGVVIEVTEPVLVRLQPSVTPQ